MKPYYESEILLPSEIDDVVRFAEIRDVPYIVNLANKEGKAIGFIPKMAYESAITGVKKGKRWSDTCNDRMWVCVSNGDLVGFCLASFGKPNEYNRRGKIAQICIQEDARKISRGRLLLTYVILYGRARGCCNYGCGCADDLESNFFWKCMGWRLVATRKGICHSNTWVESSSRLVNIYYLDDFKQYKMF